MSIRQNERILFTESSNYHCIPLDFFVFVLFKNFFDFKTSWSKDKHDYLTCWNEITSLEECVISDVIPTNTHTTVGDLRERERERKRQTERETELWWKKAKHNRATLIVPKRLSSSIRNSNLLFVECVNCITCISYKMFLLKKLVGENGDFEVRTHETHQNFGSCQICQPK